MFLIIVAVNKFGEYIAKGMSIEDACKEIGQTVEGIPTTKEVTLLAKKYHLFLPLFFMVDDILKKKKTTEEALN